MECDTNQLLMCVNLLMLFSLTRITCHEIVCSNINIRNNVSEFHKLDNCTVVEGFVRIALIEVAEQKQYESLSFPQLKEITDHLLIFRVFNLTSLEKLFPNLSVIRGRNLLHNYALILRNVVHLQRIGLKNLRHIPRGGVRIENNPNLCFADTIDWNLISRTTHHYINANKKRWECQSCSPDCPKEGYQTFDGKIVGDSSGRLCWSENLCQKTCHELCARLNVSCFSDNSSKCCSDKCLGGCKLESDASHSQPKEKCEVCRGVVYRGECLHSCPNDTYEYLGRRCLTQLECVELSEKFKTVYLKPYDYKCNAECPNGYEEDVKDRHKCVSCKGLCPKVCPETLLNNIESIQSLKGCTIINGTLEINLYSGGANVIRELDENLNLLQEIKGSLKIFHSALLVNLNFLKSLRIIHGEKLEREFYSFLVIDNPNLQDFWTFGKNNANNLTNKTKLEIKKGKIFVHINPHLCYNKIRKLNSYAIIREHPYPWEIHDVSPASNGDKVACDMLKLDLNISVISSRAVSLEFVNFKKEFNDSRKLLGYLINYKEAPYKNVSIYDDQDPCKPNSWFVIDYGSSNENGKNVKINITKLKPFTQYVLYIKTYSIHSYTLSQEKDAQSDLQYFTTKEDTPSHPYIIEAFAKSESEIFISWKPPKSPNGVIAYYMVIVKEIVNQNYTIKDYSINYCDHSISLDLRENQLIDEHRRKKINIITDNVTTEIIDKNEWETSCCPCESTPKIINNKEEVERRNNEIEFENYFINVIYIKRLPDLANKIHERMKRSLNQINIMKFIVTETNKILKDLKHFTRYSIEVMACHLDKCSIAVSAYPRTLPKANADAIDESFVRHYNQNGSILVVWDEPKDPNGYIVTYNIEYHLLSKKQPQPICIVNEEFIRNNKSYLIHYNLIPGKYSYRLRANSIAGPGNWTKLFYFEIEEPTADFKYIWFLVFSPILLIVIVASFYLRSLANKRPANDIVVSSNPAYPDFSDFDNFDYKVDPVWEKDRNLIIIKELIGSGAFGFVHEGVLQEKDSPTKCAVKVLRSNVSKLERNNFLKEAHRMKDIGNCYHVVKLLGIVSNDPVLVLMEFMANGDLKKYLQNNRPDSEFPTACPPTLKLLKQMAIEIADGMAYLESQNFVHRDLAARNCMVSHDLTVKIGDFGMTRDLYELDYYNKGENKMMPIRWMAPEAIRDGQFMSSSDIWSYGVVLWEMVTLGSQPYQGKSNDEVMTFVTSGHTLCEPDSCPHQLWHIMCLCWNKPKYRPTFSQIVDLLLPEASERFREVGFSCNQQNSISNKHFRLIWDNISSKASKQVSKMLLNSQKFNVDNDDVHYIPMSGRDESKLKTQQSSGYYINAFNCTQMYDESNLLLRDDKHIKLIK